MLCLLPASHRVSVKVQVQLDIRHPATSVNTCGGAALASLKAWPISKISPWQDQSHNVRIDPTLKSKVTRFARAEGKNVSGLIRELL